MQPSFLHRLAGRVPLLLLLAVCLQLLPQQSAAQSKKQADIQQLMDVMYGDKLLDGILAATAESLQLETGVMKMEVVDSLRALLLPNLSTLRDSIAGVYDRLYTANEIKEMIKVYQTPIGKRIIETQTELMQQSMAVGRAWGQAHAEEIDRVIAPIVAKYRISQAEDTYGSGDNLLPDTEMPVVKNHPNNKRTLQGSKPYEYALLYDEKAWKYIPAKDLSPLADLALAHKEEEIYMMLIAETSKMPLKNLRAAALMNLHRGASQVKIRKNALRQVNGKEVLVMIIDCAIDDLELTYYNYYYSGSWGVLQLMVFGDRQSMKEQQKAVEGLLSGLLAE